MTLQKHLFELPEDIHYLNGAFMSPLLKTVKEAGFAGIERKCNPSDFLPMDFFTPAEEVKRKFGRLVNADPAQVAILPSVSYGLKSAVNNLPLNTGSRAVIAAQEFASDYYTLESWCRKNSKQLEVIGSPLKGRGRGAAWNQAILEAITPDTAVVVIAPAHWADGTLFRLEEIGDKCHRCQAMLIVDGTQAVGAMPLDVARIGIDVLICAAYKWLMGPYSIGLGFYSESFNDGEPIENSWMTHSNAYDFTAIGSYTDSYFPGAARYSVGEFSNPVLLPMLDRALVQILDWKPQAVQAYCAQLIDPLIAWCDENGFRVEEPDYRSSHLFGLSLPGSVNRDKLLESLRQNKISISVRGEAIRVSPNVYNDPEDIAALIGVLKESI